MGLFGGKKQNRAGLALGEEGLKYLELSGDKGNLKVSRIEHVALSSDAMRQDSIAVASLVGDGMEAVKRQIGSKWASLVTLGLPPHDVLIRSLEFPAMSLEDAREALRWEFDKYFPYSYVDATADVSTLEVPIQPDPNKMTLLVASSRLSVIEKVLDIAGRAVLPPGPIEPAHVGMFRSAVGPIPRFDGAFLTLFIERKTAHIILGYKDSGILFRSILPPNTEDREAYAMTLGREVNSTFTYARSQYRGLQVEEVLVGGELGADESIQQAIAAVAERPVTPLDLWSLWGVERMEQPSWGWEAAFGLAVRDLV